MNNPAKIEVLSLVFLLVTVSLAYFSYKNAAVSAFAVNSSGKVVVIDAGHGGWDPGKPGVSGVDENSINLEIADYLQSFLESSGSTVIMTRISDDAMADKKKDDLFARKELAKSYGADVAISIHQNAFPQENVKGAQTFYSSGSEQSKALAEAIQKRLCENADKQNKRVSKPGDSYYLLKSPHVPTVIVECGFLSNTGEEKKLNSPEYQRQIAWSVYCGINDYFGGLN